MAEAAVENEEKEGEELSEKEPQKDDANQPASQFSCSSLARQCI